MTGTVCRRGVLGGAFSGGVMLGLFSAGGRVMASPSPSPSPEPVPDGRSHVLGFDAAGFHLDGAPFHMRAGEMHPVRIPHEDWAARIAMARAMGLNTISIYLMWNTLEPVPGQFDLTTDRRDFRHFITLCQQAGMWVFLRPGPYICGEWDFGGLPAWLLFDGDIRVRSMDPAFLAAAERYIATIAQAVRPLLAENGGPILMTQVENEYASFGGDLAYMAWTRAAWQRNGIGGPFATADGLTQIVEKRTILRGCALGLDGDYDLARARGQLPGASLWVSEAYPGWLTHWGEPHMQKVDFAPDFRRILAQKASFNLYVVHGGTNFGFGAGANAHRDGGTFQPVVTSYDYDAPIDEAGRATPKYHAMRAMIQTATGRAAPAIPPDPPMSGFAPVTAEAAGSIWPVGAAQRAVPAPVSMERGLRQASGMVLYRCVVPAGAGGALHLPPVHDEAVLFLDEARIGTVSRMAPARTPILIAPAPAPRTLEVLVDSYGHVGFGQAMGDRKGMEGPATLGETPLRDWAMFGLPLTPGDVRTGLARAVPANGRRPGHLYRARFTRGGPGGTYVDMRGWKRGYVWVNGHALGRYSASGPQLSLFCPATFLREGSNEVVVLDLLATAPAAIAGVTALLGL